MFKKVLIAEDHESANISVQKTLADLGVKATEYTYYCDDALLHIARSIEEHKPFDLLITDLSFEEDHRPQKISDGKALIMAVKQLQPKIKVLVFSAENKRALIDSLFNELDIDAYVRKGRHDAKDLKLAIETIRKNNKHITADLKQKINENNAHEFTHFDVSIISLLSAGMLQKDIPLYLKQNNIKPSGLSSLEKRLNVMKEALNFSKNEQLVAYCKDFGII
ncbi:two-component system capsular synthesis response regulator RcsB [Pedobacter sp. UYP30]|uniref:response regulator n=1 Tax=Pedobacter sp. UYP30 TaxID=1756400 RepID=UPI0033962E1E